MSYGGYEIIQQENRRWQLTAQVEDGTGDRVVLGTYDTAAQALDVSAVPIYPGTGSSSGYAIVLPLGSGIFYPAYKPHMPFDWEALPPSPTGIEFAEVSRAEMLRFVRGEFAGFKVLSSEATHGGYSETGGNTVAFTGTYEVSKKFERAAPDKQAYVRSPQKALEFAGGVPGTTDGGPLFPYLPLGFSLNAQPDEQISVGYTTVTEPDGTAHTFPGGPLVGGGVGISFYRGSHDKSCRLFAVVNGASDTIWAYAPVTVGASGLNFHDVYGIPQVPADETLGSGTSSTTVENVEISGDGPSILGVGTRLFGWKRVVTDSGTITGTTTTVPSLDAQEM